MKNLIVVVIIIIFFSIFAVLNYYIGLRGWQALFKRIPGLPGWLYWLVFWVIALSYLAARFGQPFLPSWFSERLTLVGAFWLAAMFYFILILILVDIVRMLDRLLNFIPTGFKTNPIVVPSMGILVLTVVVAIIAYGYCNARNPRITHYDLTISKEAGSLDKLHAVMVSDLHLGTIIHNGRLTQMTDMIKALNPDIVLFAGDVIDENVAVVAEKQMEESFRQLKPKFGTYAVLGNHEYIGGHAEEIIKYLKAAGVKVLRDGYAKVGDAFYIIGRDDRSGQRFTGDSRLRLSELMEGINKSLPVILLDHQPTNLEESHQNGVDLQLSGHTHRGQLFPNQWITELIYEVDWGQLRKGNLQVIVSSGYGTWGPPIRVGNIPEIVDINIKFIEKSGNGV